MIAKASGALAKFDEKRRVVPADQITPQAVADDDDDARITAHGSTPFSAAAKISKLRCRRDCARAAYSAVSGADSRNGTVCSPAPPCERNRCPASADRSCSAAEAPST